MTHSSEHAAAARKPARSLRADTPERAIPDLAAVAEPPLGAHLTTPRHGYHHHGIYVGNGMVVHYAGYCHRQQRGPVEALSLARFAAGHGIAVLAAPLARYSAAESVIRARSRLGENSYRLLTNNCEHFCMWCLYGESRSEQVRHCLVHPLSGLRLAAAMLMSWWKSLDEPVCGYVVA